MKRKLVFLGLVLALIALPVAACAQEAPAPAPAPTVTVTAPAPAPAPAPTVTVTAPAPEVIRLLLASTGQTSSYFPSVVASAEIINKYVPGVEVTVVTSEGGFANVSKIIEGETDLATLVTTPVLTSSYYGTGTGAEYYAPDLRVMFPDSAFVYLDAVRADSDVTSYEDLDGKDFHLGRPGSSATLYAETLFELIGIAPVPFMGTFADAQAGVKDRRSVGMRKASSLNSLDAVLLDITATTPIRLLSMTEELAEKLVVEIPGSTMFRIPAGTYEALPDHPEIIGLGGVTNMCALSTQISQDLGYKLTKA